MKKRYLHILLAVLLALSAGAVWMAVQYDRPVREALVKAQGKNFRKSDDYKFYGAVRQYGDWPELMLAGGVGLLVAWRMRSREWMRILAAAMIASTMAGMIANSLRLTTGRTRPRESPRIEQGIYGPWHNGKLTIGDSTYNSFPSGHTATAFGFAGVIVFASPWIGIGALFLAGLIGWSSIAIGAHHPSDVTVAIILAFVVAWFVWRWVRLNGEYTLRSIKVRWKRFRSRPKTSR